LNTIEQKQKNITKTTEQAQTRDGMGRWWCGFGSVAQVEQAGHRRYFQQLDFTKPPATVEKTFKIFLSKKNHWVAMKASETT